MQSLKMCNNIILNFLLILAFLFSFSGICQSQNSDLEARTSQSEISYKEQQFQNYLEEIYKKHKIPAVAAAVITSQGIMSKGVYGVRSLDSDEVVTLEDRFHIGSNTKAMTGYLAGLLVDEDLIQWNSKILDIFPEFKQKAKKAYASITLRDLLSHRAGILPFKSGADFEQVPDFEGTATQKRKLFSEWLLQQESLDLDARGFTYSNAGYCIAAAALEKVSQTSWEHLIQNKLFDPLELDGQVGWPAQNNAHQPLGHWIRSGKLVPHDPHDEYQLPDIISPAGNINMSILDYANWLQTILQGIRGEDTIVKSSTNNFLLYGNMEFSPYSMGWGSSKRNGLTISSHDGSAGTFYCHAVVIKELDLAIVVFANCMTPDTSKGLHEFRQKIVEMYKMDRKEK